MMSEARCPYVPRSHHPSLPACSCSSTCSTVYLVNGTTLADIFALCRFQPSRVTIIGTTACVAG
jgi:hypothetical protein